MAASCSPGTLDSLATGAPWWKRSDLVVRARFSRSAVLAAGFPDVGIGLLGVSLAFGLTVLTMAYAIGHISGCHLNPAVSFGLWAGGRFDKSELLPYIVAQVAGGLAGATILYLIASGQAASMRVRDSPPTVMVNTLRADTA